MVITPATADRTSAAVAGEQMERATRINVLRASVHEAANVSQALHGLYHREPAGALEMAASLRDPDFVLYLAYSDRTCVGYLHGELLSRLDGERMLLIYDVEVDKNHRRSGVASEMMRTALRLAENSDVTRCLLLTAPDNAAARGLYESLDGDEFRAIGFGWNLV